MITTGQWATVSVQRSESGQAHGVVAPGPKTRPAREAGEGGAMR